MDFLNKKSWHPSKLANVEKVWKAEQEADAERKKMQELQRKLIEERQIEELRKVQGSSNLRSKPRQERLDWMYEGAALLAQTSGEEFLKGKPPTQEQIDTQATKPASEAPAEGGGQPPAQSQSAGLGLFENEKKVSAEQEAWNRIKEDPLLEIKRKEKEARDLVTKNPVKIERMKRLKTQLESMEKARKDLKKMKKREKKRAREFLDKEGDKERKKKEKKEKKRSRDEEPESERGEKKRRTRDSGERDGRDKQERERDERDHHGRKRHREEGRRHDDEERDRGRRRDDDDHERKKRKRDEERQEDRRKERRRSSKSPEVGDESDRGHRHHHHHQEFVEKKAKEGYGLAKANGERYEEKITAPQKDLAEIQKEAAAQRKKEREERDREAKARRQERLKRERELRGLSSEERERKLKEMQEDASRNEERRMRNMKAYKATEVKEEKEYESRKGDEISFLNNVQKEAYGTSTSIEERLKRNAHFRYRGNLEEGNTFRK